MKEIDVLKITRTETPTEEKWILQGRLVGLWVSELRRNWKRLVEPTTGGGALSI